MARVYAKGQVTIPKTIREATGIGVGDTVIIEARADEVVVRRPRGVLEFEPPAAAAAPVDADGDRERARAQRVARRRWTSAE